MPSQPDEILPSDQILNVVNEESLRRSYASYGTYGAEEQTLGGLTDR